MTELEAKVAGVEVAAHLSAVRSAQDVISFRDVDTVTPRGECTMQGVTVEISAEQGSTMVTGVSASGKSSFFRVLGGLWPIQVRRLRALRPLTCESCSCRL